MIYSIYGTVVILDDDETITINTSGGMTYECRATKAYINRVKNRVEYVNCIIDNVLVYPVIREDSWDLYAFHSIQSRSIFIDLLSVPKVGPAKAFTILNSSEDVYLGVIYNDISKIVCAGVKDNLAQAIIKKLKNKWSNMSTV